MTGDGTMANTYVDAVTKRVDVNGTSFVYREAGEKNGIPIVLLHHLTAVLDDSIAQVIAQNHPDLVRRMIRAGTSAAGGEGISNVAAVLQNAVARATAEKKHPKQSLFFTLSQDGQKAAAEFLHRLGTRQQG